MLFILHKMTVEELIGPLRAMEDQFDVDTITNKTGI
jgi:hypothetical protein